MGVVQARRRVVVVQVVRCPTLRPATNPAPDPATIVAATAAHRALPPLAPLPLPTAVHARAATMAACQRTHAAVTARVRGVLILRGRQPPSGAHAVVPASHAPRHALRHGQPPLRMPSHQQHQQQRRRRPRTTTHGPAGSASGRGQPSHGRIRVVPRQRRHARAQHSAAGCMGAPRPLRLQPAVDHTASTCTVTATEVEVVRT